MSTTTIPGIGSEVMVIMRSKPFSRSPSTTPWAEDRKTLPHLPSNETDSGSQSLCRSPTV
jgi:hypothetical protein